MLCLHLFFAMGWISHCLINNIKSDSDELYSISALGKARYTYSAHRLHVLPAGDRLAILTNDEEDLQLAMGRT